MKHVDLRLGSVEALTPSPSPRGRGEPESGSAAQVRCLFRLPSPRGAGGRLGEGPGVRVFALLLLTLLVACGREADGRGQTGAPGAGGPPPGVPVRVAEVVREAVPVRLAAIGTVESPAAVSVRSRVGGAILRVHFREGEEVKKGQLLFEIDPQPYRVALAQAEAALERDRVRARNLEQDAARYADLVQKDYVTREQYEQLRTEAEAARATVAAEQAAVDDAKLRLGYCQIRAPITGRTGGVLLDAGNLVKADDEKPLVVLHQLEPIDVRFTVPQQYLAQVRRRAGEGTLETTAEIPDSGAPPVRGELSFIDNAVDMATGTIALKATFANHDRVLWPGQFVRVALDLAIEENAVVAPAEAVQTGQQGDYVFVVKDDASVESRPVEVARTAEGRAVIRQGLEPGETVVTDGQLRLVPGARVEIKQPEIKPAGETSAKPEAGS